MKSYNNNMASIIVPHLQWYQERDLESPQHMCQITDYIVLFYIPNDELVQSLHSVWPSRFSKTKAGTELVYQAKTCWG